ncbi:MAG: hypothetical protein QG612_2579, partial [Pseudomonadota bacterium]|nr:hypothetical protein [Pseudomonadota bacterium]
MRGAMRGAMRRRLGAMLLAGAALASPARAVPPDYFGLHIHG